MIQKTTFVFLSRHLGPSGSEILLMKLLRELVKNESLEIVLIGYNDGRLVTGLDKRIKYFSLQSFRRKQSSFFKRKLRPILGKKNYNIENDFLNKIYKIYPSSIWILNTLAMVSPLAFIKQNHIRSAIWIHEMDVCYYWLNDNDLQYFRSVPLEYICVSKIVASFAMGLGVKGNVNTVYPGVFSINDVLVLQPKIDSGDKLIVGMAGGIDVNKNPIYLVNFAKFLKKKNETRFKILWVGGDEKNGMFGYMNAVIQNEGLEHLISFTGHQQEDYYGLIQKIDIFLLTSYVDSFPLVMLDAAHYGIPVAGWESGGIVEFVNGNPAIGEILPERSFETLYKFLLDCVNGNRIFDQEAIIERSKYFSLERFLEDYETRLRKLSD